MQSIITVLSLEYAANIHFPRVVPLQLPRTTKHTKINQLTSDISFFLSPRSRVSFVFHRARG